MRSTTATLSTLVVVLSVAAETEGQSYLYSPPFLATFEGVERTVRFGYSPAVHYQWVDGELRGNSVSLKEVALRRDETSGLARPLPVGRTWSSVVIRLADGDRATFGTDFTKNTSSTPTVVFSGSVTWPTIGNTKVIRPAPWGGATGAYKFPFTNPWVYGGTTDVICDWTKSGGTLANNWVWNVSTPAYYPFDGFGAPDSFAISDARQIPFTRLDNNSPGVSTRCNDTAFGSYVNGAYLQGEGQVYGSAPKDPALKNKVRVRSTSFLTAPNALTLHGWGFTTDDRGIGVGTGCNRFHILGPLIVQGVLSGSAMSETPWAAIPWKQSYANGRITMQAAWSDSTSSRLALTQALELTLPGHAPPDRLVLRSGIIQESGQPVRGPHTTGVHNPVLRYAY